MYVSIFGVESVCNHVTYKSIKIEHCYICFVIVIEKHSYKTTINNPRFSYNNEDSAEIYLAVRHLWFLIDFTLRNVQNGLVIRGVSQQIKRNFPKFTSHLLITCHFSRPTNFIVSMNKHTSNKRSKQIKLVSTV